MGLIFGTELVPLKNTKRLTDVREAVLSGAGGNIFPEHIGSPMGYNFMIIMFLTKI